MDSENDGEVLWEHRFEELCQWQKVHGDCNVPKAEGKLGRWVVRQRELHKKSKLEWGRQRKLEKLGFIWNTNEAAWEHKYALLVKYKETHGHSCVPISDNVLGMWVAKMRANRRRNKLAQHRVDKLNAIAFIWNTAEADWKDKYNRLLDFRSVNGHSCVPFNEGELGWWVNTQRQNKRKGKLLPHRELLLNEASFIWAPQEFLAARRKQVAATRARKARHLYNMSTEPLYRNQILLFSKQYSQNHVGHSPISPPHGYAKSSLKRRRPSYLDSAVLGAIPCKNTSAMPSPTSVKRIKWMESFVDSQQAPHSTAVTETNTTTSNGAGQSDGSASCQLPLMGRLQFQNDTAGRTVDPAKELRREGQSVAVTTLQGKKEQQYPEALSCISVLSSICGIQSINRHRVSALPRQEHSGDFVLPPISSFRGFENSKTSEKSATT